MAHRAVRPLAIVIAMVMLALPLACEAAPKKAHKKGTGAMAYHRASGSFGYAVNAADSRSARIAALNGCGHPQCEIVASLDKDCGALANGPMKFIASRGATRQEAETRALRLCGEGCKIVGWACPR